MKWFFPVMIIVGVLVSVFAVRGEKESDGSLTKRGFVKILIVLAVLFLASFGTVYFTR
ncbi:DUF3976 domain-containing protein [Bacillus salacetis]|uniref:DUF3976 domain-containing protein n=1 Tax=Bacillus salacetis TaxID=2315464 RepID=A0A3A1QYI5_9BACI|nr:DUF3976 domain-containing protein [Bacillus salacetis]RIW33098.1 DUF3976 domain-containing protein [Bacillus salacetis]